MDGVERNYCNFFFSKIVWHLLQGQPRLSPHYQSHIVVSHNSLTSIMNPLNKIIFLSAFLAFGFLLILLSCALYNNWLPLWVIAVFLVAPLPNIILSSIENNRDDFLTFSNDHANTPLPLQEFAKFFTGLLIVSGVALPLMLYHCWLIDLGSLVMSITGGLIVYSDICVFIWFFSESEEENDDFNF
ncbi:hypothetical protein PUMCH_001847 [Australozyma saopauloensis]|uniref:Vacuolar protein sorting 55 n=1 Tax=Australozyma saopauloensis TaxID=291208 RepID=A0AAX4H7V2_9ASCO|nr:hypothetical protein PUMCH_001847 [[Candida] saopauloensis]